MKIKNRISNKNEQAPEKKGHRRKRNRKKEILMVLIPALVFAAVAVGVMCMQKNMTSKKLDQGGVRYYAGGSYAIEKEAKLQRTDEEKTVLVTSAGKVDATSLAIYPSEDGDIVFPENMIYYEGRTAEYGLVDYFTSISMQQKNVLKREDKSYQTNGGFLYDGADYYFFLEPVVLRVNGHKRELSAFSSVEVYAGTHVSIYEYGSQKSYYEETESDVTAEGMNFSVSLKNDTLTMMDGNRLLLFARPELLDHIWK